MRGMRTRSWWPLLAAFMVMNVGWPGTPPGPILLIDGAPAVKEHATCPAARTPELDHPVAIVASPPTLLRGAPAIVEHPTAAAPVTFVCILGSHLARAPPLVV